MIGEEAYKGRYSFKTSWINDIVRKDCVYPTERSFTRGNFTRKCLPVTDIFSRKAVWEEIKEFDDLTDCLTKHKATAQMQKLQEELSRKDVSSN